MKATAIAVVAPQQRKFGTSGDISPTSREVVVGLVGYAGAGCSTVCRRISSTMEKAGYSVEEIKLSRLLADYEKDQGRALPTDQPETGKGKLERARCLQDAGDWKELVYFCIIDFRPQEGEKLIWTMNRIDVSCIFDLRRVPTFGEIIRKHKRFFENLTKRHTAYIDLSYGSSRASMLRHGWFNAELRSLVRSAFEAAPRGVCLFLADPEDRVDQNVRRIRNLIAHKGEQYVELHPMAIQGSWR